MSKESVMTERAVLNGIDVSDILAYQAIHPGLHTSGQPTAEQFASIRAAGVDVVVNVALTNASNGLIHQGLFEDRIVLDLGMDYVHLPLVWDQPSAAQAFTVLKYIHHLQGQTVWLHCAKNMRVSCLMYLYRLHWLGYSIDEAQPYLQRIWEPNATWTGLMNAVAMQIQADYP